MCIKDCMPFAGMHLGMPSIRGIKKPCCADETSGEVKLAKREQASSESADEISGEVTACSHCLQPGFFRVSQLVDSRVLNPSYIDEDSFLFPMVVSHSVESLHERALVINRRQPNCNC